MKPRTPVGIIIIIAVCLITGAFLMLLQNFKFINNPIYLGTIVISIVLLLINNSIDSLIDAGKFKNLSEEEKNRYLELLKTPYFTRLWRDAFKRSKEEELGEIAILDHGYDGIQELDNQLPKWYIGLFAITITCGVIYFFAYIFTDFAHPIAEYDAEYKTQLAEIAEYEKTVPQATIETAQYNPEAIEEGKKIYNNLCITCHGEGATGGSGPNQTDDYWLNIVENDEFKNIVSVVWNGSKTNPTMRSFINSGELKGNDIVKVASYLVHLNETTKKNPDGSSAGKAPQGDIAPWVKNPQAIVEAAKKEGKEVKVVTEVSGN
ncbi:c-type cytochrome [Apibacter muscae]|uniref:cbb3-type cytochrome c oxidase N-terminal domain-containing protein n=1 Tax=Apibacter muscae TaxID=2509004 RepID=UPI0011ADCF47|nr:cbb3-type cytochrome c oxidase N-terminal domain-containing protein [Apibacter muscae]TWP24737.1 c-type cytochrome [Apibacter muscae]